MNSNAKTTPYFDYYNDDIYIPVAEVNGNIAYIYQLNYDLGYANNRFTLTIDDSIGL